MAGWLEPNPTRLAAHSSVNAGSFAVTTSNGGAERQQRGTPVGEVPRRARGLEIGLLRPGSARDQRRWGTVILTTG